MKAGQPLAEGSVAVLWCLSDAAAWHLIVTMQSSHDIPTYADG